MIEGKRKKEHERKQWAKWERTFRKGNQKTVDKIPPKIPSIKFLTKLITVSPSYNEIQHLILT